MLTMLRIWLSRVLGLFGRHWRDEDLADDIRAHLDLLTAEHRRRGLSSSDAAAAARREFGGVEQVKEAYRDRRGLPIIEQTWQDVRYALRQMRRNKGFTTTALLTLALGLGASVAIFCLVDAVLLRPLSYPDSSRLVVINESIPTLPDFPVNAVHFEWWRTETRSFAQMALIGELTVNVTGTGEPELVPAARISPSLFTMLGVHMQLGRAFTADEDRAGRDRVLVLDNALWRRRFGADPHVIGRTMALDGAPYEIVGVLPRDFHFPRLRDLMPIPTTAERPQIWKPFGLRPDERKPIGAFNNICLARLKPGVSLSQARDEIEREQASLAARWSQRLDLHASIVPLQAQIVERSRLGLELLFAAIASVLLIGCLNITNLLLVKTFGRRRELAIRQALGAARSRLVRQSLAESLTLCLLGGVAAVVVAHALVQIILAVTPADVPRLDEVRFDAGAVALTLGLAALMGLALGLLPAARSARVDLADAMRRQATVRNGRWSSYARSWLVGAEVALSAVCLIASGLLLHSLLNLLSVPKGFEASRLATATVKLPLSRYPTLETRAAFERALIERVQAMPGVSAVAIQNQLPLRGIGAMSPIVLEGRGASILDRPIADVRTVNAEYFATWEIPLRAGRIFDEADGPHLVAVVSQFTAEHAWPGRSPIGQHVRFSPEGPPYEVIGVVGDVRGVGLDRAPTYAVYVPYWQRGSPFAALAVKTRVDPATIWPAVREAVHRLDPELPVLATQTMADIVDESTSRRRFQLDLVLLFAIAAMLSVGLGMYGVLSYAVGQRTREIGIRLALGAEPSAVRRQVIRDAMRLTASGLIVGVPLALAGASSLRSLLFGVAPGDVLTLIGVCVVLAATAWLAAYVPARRASRVDPTVALRVE